MEMNRVEGEELQMTGDVPSCFEEYCGKRKPELKTMSSLARRPSVTIDFFDLYYSVVQRGKSGVKKDILQGVSGSFRCGELTAIMGSSGAGKSTLMNILAGYVTSGIRGAIKINGHPRQTKAFRRLSSYIMQDDLVQPHLTVGESMHFAAKLKLGRELQDQDKQKIAREILEMLGLKNCYSTRCEKLSGGQRKRLSVALELVSNPPVVFLDEPTTGLDTVSTNQMVKLLYKLAGQGRTIVCTIHQPSASVLEMFDKLYVMSRGKCVYQGSQNRLVQFMSSLSLHCPIRHNPADYIIEVIQGENEGIVNAMIAETQNGKISIERKRAMREEIILMEEEDETVDPGKCGKNDRGKLPTTFLEQCSILLERKIKQQLRDTVTLWLMVIHHIASGSFLGTIFLGVGSDADRPYDNFKFIISVVVFFMYTHVMCPVLLFPTEVRLIRREYFNRWYNLKSYFLALTLSTLPSHIVLGLIVTSICYVLSGQPLELFRYICFTCIGLTLGLVSEGWGLAIGSVFSEMNGSIVGPASVVPLLAVSVYGMGFGTVIEPGMQGLMSLSYLRYGIVGFSSSLYGFNRSNLYCDYKVKNYCHYKDPLLLMKDLGMEGLTFGNQIMALVVFLFVHRILAFLCLRYQLTSEFSNRILMYATKTLRRHPSPAPSRSPDDLVN